MNPLQSQFSVELKKLLDELEKDINLFRFSENDTVRAKAEINIQILKLQLEGIEDNLWQRLGECDHDLAQLKSKSTKIQELKNLTLYYQKAAHIEQNDIQRLIRFLYAVCKGLASIRQSERDMMKHPQEPQDLEDRMTKINPVHSLSGSAVHDPLSITKETLALLHSNYHVYSYRDKSDYIAKTDSEKDITGSFSRPSDTYSQKTFYAGQSSNNNELL